MGESPRTRALLSAALILTVAILSACGPREDRSSGEVLVFSAASLQDVMSDIEDLYEAGGGPKVSFSFGGSQVLAQQIASGAPADVFISAGEAPMEFLNERALVGQPADVLSNSLVVAVRSGNTPDLKSFADLAGPAVSRLAIADPNLAPAGRYAREALQGLGVWESLGDRLVFGSDVRATLAFVESGNADAAIVYRTDVLGRSRGLVALDIVPPESYGPISYPAAVVLESALQQDAGRFVELLLSDEAAALFRAHGFEPTQ